jgi:hypothetical protein
LIEIQRLESSHLRAAPHFRTVAEHNSLNEVVGVSSTSLLGIKYRPSKPPKLHYDDPIYKDEIQPGKGAFRQEIFV